MFINQDDLYTGPNEIRRSIRLVDIALRAVTL
jgi:hypothetical protein